MNRKDKPFASRHLRQLLGISSQQTAVHLNRLVATGELIRTGTGNGTKYQPGPNWEKVGIASTALTSNTRSVWTEIARRCPLLVYVELRSFRRSFRLRSQVLDVFPELDENAIIVVDLDDIEDVSDAFADALHTFLDEHYGRLWLLINAAPQVKAVLDRARANHDQPREYDAVASFRKYVPLSARPKEPAPADPDDIFAPTKRRRI